MRIDTPTNISAVVSTETDLSVEINAETNLSVEISAKMFDRSDFYRGPYAADALFREQEFPTASKVMSADFLVHAINYTEAPNDSGVTVTIGG